MNAVVPRLCFVTVPVLFVTTNSLASALTKVADDPITRFLSRIIIWLLSLSNLIPPFTVIASEMVAVFATPFARTTLS